MYIIGKAQNKHHTHSSTLKKTFFISPSVPLYAFHIVLFPFLALEPTSVLSFVQTLTMLPSLPSVYEFQDKPFTVIVFDVDVSEILSRKSSNLIYGKFILRLTSFHMYSCSLFTVVTK